MKTICSDDREQIGNEINLMQMFDHPHIVKFYGEFKYSSDIHCILMEYCQVTNYNKQNFPGIKSKKQCLIFI